MAAIPATEQTPLDRWGVPTHSLKHFNSMLESTFLSGLGEPTKSKAYTLIVCTTPSNTILLGLKLRGFGTGKYNSFGGKIEENESPDAAASRELEEETGIVYPTSEISSRKVGVLNFTFQDSPKKMIVHLYHVAMSPDHVSQVVFTCDEISPEWFPISKIPYEKMFSDDHTWLPLLLEKASIETVPKFDGYFHFAPGGDVVNSVLFHHVEYHANTLEKRLFSDLHAPSKARALKPKEFNESYALFNLLNKAFPGKRHIVDVCGGHGAVAAIFLAGGKAHTGVVIDPATPGRLNECWADHMGGKRVEYIQSELEVDLAPVLSRYDPRETLVLAAHACQFLTESVLTICADHFVDVAVMPCCQKPSQSVKSFAKSAGVDVAVASDLMTAGSMMKTHDVTLKLLAKSITPQNRVILCKLKREGAASQKDDLSRVRLRTAYAAAHRNQRPKSQPKSSRSIYVGLVLLACAALLTIPSRGRR